MSMTSEDWLDPDADDRDDANWDKCWNAAWAVATLGAKQIQTAAAKVAEAMDSLLLSKNNREFMKIERGKGW
jgi:hypothetical protein